jgi:hypothetical protein
MVLGVGWLRALFFAPASPFCIRRHSAEGANAPAARFTGRTDISIEFTTGPSTRQLGKKIIVIATNTRHQGSAYVLWDSTLSWSILKHEFLATEQDKLRYFIEQRNLEADVLPSRAFRVRSVFLTRHFVDGFPHF